MSSVDYTLPGEHWFNGIRYIKLTPPEALSGVADLPVHEDDVYVCAFPKTGTTWMSTIVSAILHQDNLQVWLKDRNRRAVYSLEFTDPRPSNLPRHHLHSSHLPYYMLPDRVREKKVKMIHISRDPKDAAVSFYYFHRNNGVYGPWAGDWNTFYDNFISGQVAFGSYFSFVRSYWERKDDPNIMNIHYELLKADTNYWIGKIADFIGKPLLPEILEEIVRLTEFTNMKESPFLNPEFTPGTLLSMRAGTSFFRKGIVGDWRHLFSEYQRHQIDGLYRQLCKDTGMEDFVNEEQKIDYSKVMK